MTPAFAPPLGVARLAPAVGSSASAFGGLAVTTGFLTPPALVPCSRRRRPWAPLPLPAVASPAPRTASVPVASLLPLPSFPALPAVTTALGSSAPMLAAAVTNSVTSLASGVTGLAVLAFIIVVHEAGHFAAARAQGIRVKNFSIGFGPALLSFTPPGSETEFTLRALPLGGYVAFPDATVVDEETGEETESTDADLLQNRPLLDRALVLSAGVAANIVLAYAAVLLSVTTAGVPVFDLHPGVVVSSLADPVGAGARSGIRAGDVILSLDGTKVPVAMDSANTVATAIRSSGGRPLSFEILRGPGHVRAAGAPPTVVGSDSIVETVKVQPSCCAPDGTAAMGVQLSPNARVSRVRPPASRILGVANAEFSRLVKQTLSGFSAVFGNLKEASSNLSGPVGVVSIGAQLARDDSVALLTFAAVISLNLAVMNSLPLPALDGGQLAFLVVEAVRGKAVSPKVQERVNQTALLMFVALSGALFLGDLEKLNILGAISQLFG
ncbi:hypothetical protein MMPV_000252 [Pyropia vietnamensis]